MLAIPNNQVLMLQTRPRPHSPAEKKLDGLLSTRFLSCAESRSAIFKLEMQAAASAHKCTIFLSTLNTFLS